MNAPLRNTLSRSESARLNGSKSRGPKTPQGKLACAKARYKYGLYAESLPLDQESADLFRQVASKLQAHFKPRSEAEIATVESMAFARWRQMRVRTIEPSVPGTEIRSNSSAPASSTWQNIEQHNSVLDRLGRLDASYGRQFSRGVRRLAELRANTGLQSEQEPRKPGKNLQKTKNDGRSQQIIENTTQAPKTNPREPDVTRQ